MQLLFCTTKTDQSFSHFLLKSALCNAMRQLSSNGNSDEKEFHNPNPWLIFAVNVGMPKLLFSLLLLVSFHSQAQYMYNTIVSGLKYPIAVAVDNNGNLYVSLKGGTASNPDSARVDVFDSTGVKIGQVWDFTDSVEAAGEQGVLGVTLDPNYDVNAYVYVYYNHDNPNRVRVMRFTMTAGFTGSNPTMILDIDDPNSANNHVGGNIHFRPSEPDKIYVALGERAIPSYAQDLTNPWGKILRLNSDGSIPTDNPFYDDGDPDTGNDDRIWSYGHRNQFDFAFGSNDSLYASENGAMNLDEVNLVGKGLNYGWPDCEGTMNYSGSCATPGLVAPLEVFLPLGSSLPSVTGVVFYEDTVISALQNHLLVATYIDGTVRALEMGNAPVYDTVLSAQTLFFGDFNGITDIEVNHRGCLYAVDGGYTPNGSIVEICPEGLGISVPETELVHVSPNPVHDILNIKGFSGIDYVEFYTIDGRFIRHFENVTETINVEDFKSGIYILRVVQRDGLSSVTRIVKR